MSLKYRDARRQTHTVDDIGDRLLRGLRGLSSQVSRGVLPENAVDQFAEVHSLIAALPLTTDEFGVAVNRLRNAIRYWYSGETGAARFELHLLAAAISQTQQTA